MVCIYCTEKTRTTNSRPTKSGFETWRRKSCPSCGAVFTTREQIDLSSSLRIKSAGQLLPFSRDNLFISIYRSLSHRDNALSDASDLVETVVFNLQESTNNRGILQKELLQRTTLATLELFDKPASVYYKAHYC